MMASCLGLYIDVNIIKYLKDTSFFYIKINFILLNSLLFYLFLRKSQYFLLNCNTNVI